MKRLDRSLYKKGQEITGGPSPIVKGDPRTITKGRSSAATNTVTHGSDAFNKVFGSLKALKLRLIRDNLKR